MIVKSKNCKKKHLEIKLSYFVGILILNKNYITFKYLIKQSVNWNTFPSNLSDI
jgi:hypothetical protein